MTQEEFDKAPLLDQILYDETGMLVENHPSIAEAMDKYHQAKLKKLRVGDVIKNEVSVCLLCKNEYEVLNGTHLVCGNCHAKHRRTVL